MNLPVHQLQDAPANPILNITLSTSSSSTFATATTDGWILYRLNPLTIISRQDIPNASLRIVLHLARSNILFLVGSPPSPLYPPNKVIFWDDKLAKVVTQLEFREDVRGLAARNDRLVVVLRRRLVVFVLSPGGMGVWREGVYQTCDNPAGLVALATEEGSTLLAFPGRQPGQVQLVNLPPLDSTTSVLPPSPSHDPTATPHPATSIILAHTTSLSALATTPSGNRIATASEKGTLVRVWDAAASQLIRELRRGTDSAEIFDIAFRPDGGAICVSSDKGTLHMWDLNTTREEKRRSDSGDESSRQKQFKALKPYLPKYFSSEWSHAQFRLPPPAPAPSKLPQFSLSGDNLSGKSTPTVEDDVCVCTWLEVSSSGASEGDDRQTDRKGKGKEGSMRPQFAPVPSASRPKETQIIALTRSGGWFRISLGPQEENKEEKPQFALGKEATSECRLEEYRRFGSKDGW